MPGDARRPPELRPGRGGGRALPIVRSVRIRVTDDGAVVRTDQSGRVLPLLAAGAVARLLLLDRGTAQQLVRIDLITGPVLAFVDSTGAPLLALRLVDWTPPSTSSRDPWLEINGVPALATALRLPLEPAGDADLPALRVLPTVLLRPVPSTTWPGRAAPWILSLALGVDVLGLAAMNHGGGAVLTFLALLILAPVIVSGARARAEARRATPPPGMDGRTVIRPRPDRWTGRGVARATVQIGTDDVVLTDRRREVWLRGPALGGVERVIIGPVAMRLTDADGNEYATLSTQLWAPTWREQRLLEDELRGAGLEVQKSVDAQVRISLADPWTADDPSSWLLSAAERGDATLSTPWLSGVAAAVVVVTSALMIGWNLAAGLALLAPALVLLGLRVHDLVRGAAADDRLLGKVPPKTVAVAP